MTECRQVTTTLPDREAAHRLGGRLVEERLMTGVVAVAMMLVGMGAPLGFLDRLRAQPVLHVGSLAFQRE